MKTRILFLILAFSFGASFAQEVIIKKVPYRPAPDSLPELEIPKINRPAILGISSVGGAGSGSMPTTSPEVNDINRQKGVPVNYFTGTPSVSLPIYTLTEGQLSVPISLQYNANGMRAHELAPWTGVNWHLSAGGSITRQVKGLPDEGSLELQSLTSNTFIDRKGYYFKGNSSASANLEEDLEPDLFTLSIFGQTYQFVYNFYDGIGFTFYPYQDIEVEMHYTNISGYTQAHRIDGWTITLADGVKCTFGFGAVETTAEAEAKTLQSEGMTSWNAKFTRFWKTNSVTSAWHLKKIESPYGHEINFDYDNSSYSFFRLAENQADVKCPSPADIEKNINRVMVLSSSPRTIRSRGIKVEFNRPQQQCTYDPDWDLNICTTVQNTTPREDIDRFFGSPIGQSNAKKLVEIWVMDSVQNPLDTLKYKFNYDHFISVDSTHLPMGYTLNDVGRSHLRRLKLTGVEYPDKATHEFSYAFENAPTTFYGRLTYGVDHWGFLNGETPNINATGLIAHDTHFNTCTPNTSNRETNVAFSQYGLLDTLTVSTGTQTIFTYEAHQARNYKDGATFKPIGGSRIKQIEEKDLISNVSTKRIFNYYWNPFDTIDSTESSGKLITEPIYRFQNRSENDKFYTNSGLYNYLLSTTFSPVVSYRNVQEKIVDSLGNNNGYINYNFTEGNSGTTKYAKYIGCPGTPPICEYDTVFYAEQLDIPHREDVGSLTRTTFFNNDNEVKFRKGSEVSSSNYTSIPYYRVMKFNETVISRRLYHRISKLQLRESSSSHINIDNNNGGLLLKSENFYKSSQTYPNNLNGKHNFIQESKFIDSNSDAHKSFTTYIADFNFIRRVDTIQVTCFDDVFPYPCDSLVYVGLPPQNSNAKALFEMKQRHMLNYPVEQYATKEGYLVSATYFEYDSLSGLPMSNPYSLKRTWVSDTVGTVGFVPVAYDTTALAIARSGNYYATTEVSEYNGIGLPKKTLDRFGTTSEVFYDPKDILPLRTQSNLSGIVEPQATNSYRSQLFGIDTTVSANGLRVSQSYYADGRPKATYDKDGFLLSHNEYLDYGEASNVTTMGFDSDVSLNRMIFRSPRVATLTLPDSVNELTTGVSYLNGYGQAVQEIAHKQSPDQKDIAVATSSYDSFRRSIKQFLTTAADTASGRLVANLPLLASQFYEDASPFSEVVGFEESPLARVKSMIGSGQSFRPGKEYYQNMNYGYSSSTKYVVSADGKLLKRSVPFSNGLQRITYTEDSVRNVANYDKSGRVLSQVVNDYGSPRLITYYLYDDIDRLVGVVPPLININSIAENTHLESSPYFEGIYFFKYDHRGRVVAKHTPGAGWSYTVYNQRNQPMLSQDARLEANDQWLFTKYDAFGRTAMSGVLDLDRSRDTLQKYFDSHLVAKQYEERTTTSYTDRSYPSQIIVPDSAVMSVYFYDDYSWLPADTLQFNEYKIPKWDNVTGLATGNQVRRLDTGEWLRSVQYYDDKNRIIQSQSENRFGAVNQTDMVTDFIGQLLEERTVYRRPQDSKPLIVGTAYTYDHAGRILDATHRINGNTEVLASYGYDEIGRLVKKNLNEARTDSIKRADSLNTGIQDIARRFILLEPGTVIDSSSVYLAKIAGGLQNITYAYDIRGNLRCINCDSTKNLDSAKVFAMKLDYFQDGRYYNGVLSKQTWYSQNDSTARSYTYDYDKANRLTKGDYSGKSTEDYSLPSITYDANGNVNNLKRNGQIDSTSFGLVDDLQYTYQGYTNRLNAIDDNGLDALGFTNISGVQDFSYYGDGSQKTDANKGITDITYNFLGLVERVDFGADKRIEHTFTADGQKLRTKFIDGGTTLTKDYVGDLIYINDTLRSIWHDEGRVILDPKFVYTSWSDTLGNQYVDSAFVLNAQYQYFINDHQGSTRVVFQELNDSLVIAQTIQYGVTGDIISTDSTGQNLLTHLYQGKEWLDGFGYDFVTRTYDPYSMRFLQVDGADQFASGYTGMGNAPNMGVDPDGQWVHIAAGAVIGGFVNLGIKAFQGKLNKPGDYFAAFGIGAAAGAVTAATGGAASVYATTGSFAGAFSSTAVASASTGLFGGVVAGTAGAATGGAIQGVGNAAYFGDPYSTRDWISGIGIGAVTGGIGGFISAKFQGKHWLNGTRSGTGIAPDFNKAKWLKTDVGWKLSRMDVGKLSLQFPDWVDNVGNLHQGKVSTYGNGSTTNFITSSEGTTYNLKPTLERISNGIKHSHRNDGSIFKNYPPRGQDTPLLPNQPMGYYHEYVVPTPGIRGPGAMRIVTGAEGQKWFTPDHYKTFIPIR